MNSLAEFIQRAIDLSSATFDNSSPRHTIIQEICFHLISSHLIMKDTFLSRDRWSLRCVLAFLRYLTLQSSSNLTRIISNYSKHINHSSPSKPSCTEAMDVDRATNTWAIPEISHSNYGTYEGLTEKELYLIFAI